MSADALIDSVNKLLSDKHSSLASGFNLFLPEEHQLVPEKV